MQIIRTSAPAVAALAVAAALLLLSIAVSPAPAQTPVAPVEQALEDVPAPDEESLLPPEAPNVEPDYPDVPSTSKGVAAAWHAAKPWPDGDIVLRTTPVLFVHGLSFGLGRAGKDCNDWDTMTERYRSYGHDGPLVTIKYYDSDRNCSHAISHHPDIADRHLRWYASGHKDGHHTNDTDIRHLAYHLAWYINDHWGSQTNVEVVAHSMGGLIMRYALSQTGKPGWPALLMVTHVTTLGTPHRGSGDANYCQFGSYQCKQMKPTSEFMHWMKLNVQNPQGYPSTDWTLIASDDDERVADWSGTGMVAEHYAVYTDGVRHGMYYQDVGAQDRSVFWYDRSRGNWFQWNSAPRGVLWSSRAVSTSGW